MDMEIMQIAGIGIVAAIFAVLLRSFRPELAMQVSIATGLVIFMMIASQIGGILQFFDSICNKMNIDSIYVSTVLKVTGIAYIAEFAAEICRDAGESSVASKVELGGKVLILLLSMPIISSLFDLIMKMMPG